MNKLKRFIVTTSENGNGYVYDRGMNSTLLCHPILHYIVKQAAQNPDPNFMREWINRLQEDPIEIDGLGNISRLDIDYYYRKFIFLKENGYFSEPQEELFIDSPVRPEMVEYSITNSKQVTLEVTGRCSMFCKYCGYGHLYEFSGHGENTDLDVNKAKRLITYLVDFWNSPKNMSKNKTIYISFYGGEPLLRMDFINNIVDFSKSLDLQYNEIQFSMTTNALLLEKHMDFLVENEFNLLISLDGNENHTSYRVHKDGKPAYHDIIKNVEALRNRYPEYFDARVNFNAVLHDRNSVPEIHKYFGENFDKIARIGELKNVGVKSSKQAEFMKMFSSVQNSLEKSGDEASIIESEMFIKLPGIQNLSTFLFKHSGFSFDNYNHLFSPEYYKKHIPTGTCLPFGKKIFVTVDGNLLPCETIGRELYLGQVTDDSVELDFKQIADAYNEVYKKITEQCDRCYDKEACGACIFNLPEKDGKLMCNQFKDYARFSGYLSFVLSTLEKEPKYYSRIMEEVSVE